MHRQGVPARLLRPGYSESLDRFDPDAARPIDVMFLGSQSLRRSRYLSHAARVLSRHNCLLQISETGPSPAGSSSYLADARWPLLAQTKVLINLHRGDDARLEWQRALDAIHAGAVVVTEHSSGIAPLSPGAHLLVASPDALPYVAEALLHDPERLSTLRAQAYDRLKTWIPYALWVSVLRAAVVELVGEPVPPEWASPAAQPDSEAGTDAGRGGGAHQAAASVEPAAGGADLATQNGAPHPLHAAAGHSRRVATIQATPAWRVGRTPRLSVLMALGPGCTGLGATLSSMAGSRLQDFELVLVDAGADDQVLGLAADWISARPRMGGCLLDPAVDQGVGAARNVGLDFARGPACLILDPGHELYPRCLDVLTATLESMPEIAFVYPIQEVTGDSEEFVQAGGDYLLSFLGWAPRWLRGGSPIHTPALIRARRLRDLGGFSTDERLAGLEDYDLWCRIAERGWCGQLVPQILARRPESGFSEALLAIHPSGSALAALTDHSPRVMTPASTVQTWWRRMKSPRSVR
jgi:Glycosyl transferase family 2/Glycosyl transferases group 1